MIDLHAHSIYSDGTDTPERLVELAEQAGLTALALTDHDTLEGLDRFLACQPRTGVELVPGVELSCRYLGRVLHVLGLFVDPLDPAFRARIQDMRDRRVERNRAMVARLRELGVPITWEEVAALAPTDTVSRTHFARALVARGAAGSPQDAFRRYIGDDGPAFVPLRDLTPGEAAAWIRDAGGVAVVAHPGRFTSRAFRWDEAMAELKAAGMAGLEAHYPDYGPQEHRYFLDLAADLDMVASGGSDYHGGHKPGQHLGVGTGSLHVPDAVLDQLKGRRPGCAV
ncbi:PHP domain-containing protein [Mesoterricola sediminis]|uniref:Phosphatase n=1 Tax=Mesoterricola sediminis TaxID=2927980 RepID=A0AA48KC91_9BACT|nr:PHP domain-containing protein [Mesoterricola sediminis]BDU76791.1 phosphatase [Mesoterricola sediminis]